MGTLLRRALMVAVGALVFSAGCGESQAPSQKRTRLIAAENMQLKKQIAGLEQQIDKLEKQIQGLEDRHKAEIEKSKLSLAECQKRRADCEKSRLKDIGEQVNEVLAAAMDEAAKLRAENEALKAKVAELAGQTTETTSAEQPGKKE